MPARRDIDPLDIGALLPNVVLLSCYLDATHHRAGPGRVGGL